MMRVLWLSAKAVRGQKRLLNQSDYFLSILAVDPRYKGQGFASKLLKPMLAKFDREQLVCSLDTNNPRNIQIYEKFGFRLHHTTGITPDLKEFKMLRDPAHLMSST